MAGPSSHIPPPQRASFEAARQELQGLSAELFAELIACSLVEGCSLEGRVEPQHPVEVPGLEGIQARVAGLGLSALASLDAATLGEVIREESASERRILEDLDRYVAAAPEGGGGRLGKWCETE